MEFRTTFFERPETYGLSAPCDLRQPAIVDQADRMLALAATRDIHPAKPPFAQLCGAFLAFVNLPVDQIPLDPPAQTETTRMPGGWVAVTHGVSFAEARAVTREVSMAIANDWGVNGPAEFHPEALDFERGALVLPVRPFGATVSSASSAETLVTAIPGL